MWRWLRREKVAIGPSRSTEQNDGLPSADSRAKSSNAAVETVSSCSDISAGGNLFQDVSDRRERPLQSIENKICQLPVMPGTSELHEDVVVDLPTDCKISGCSTSCEASGVRSKSCMASADIATTGTSCGTGQLTADTDKGAGTTTGVQTLGVVSPEQAKVARVSAAIAAAAMVRKSVSAAMTVHGEFITPSSITRPCATSVRCRMAATAAIRESAAQQAVAARS